MVKERKDIKLHAAEYAGVPTIPLAAVVNL
jgi:hypothetical protein